MSGMPQMEKRVKNPLQKVNWRRVRRDLLSKSVRIPAPVFFLIFFAISWACFTLYFKSERQARNIELLQQRANVIEQHLNEFSEPSPAMPEEEEELEVPPQILEM